MANEKAIEEALTVRTSVDHLEVGSRLSETQYYIVKDVDSRGVHLVNERGMPLTVSKKIVEEGMYSDGQYTSEEKISRSELIQKLANCGDAIFTVSFHKLPNADDINEAIASINKGKIQSQAVTKAAIKEAYKGRERILTGYLVNVETDFGRTRVIDLEVEQTNPNYDNRLRLVDHRSINWLICKNVKYSVK